MKIDNTYKITQSLGQAKETIKKIVDITGFNQSINIEGPSGIGKSEIIAQLAEDFNAELIDIRLGNIDTIDLNGIGIPDIKNKQAIWTRPEFFPPENCDKKYILFLDELNHASEQVFGAAYQLVLERRMGTHILPKNVLVIGAGNSIDDQGIAFDMPSPLVNRFLKINVKPNINDWIGYTESLGVDWRILGFLKCNPDYLHKFNGQSSEDNFPTPRNWIRLNAFKNHFTDEDLMEVILNGLFGFSLATQFKQYLKIVSKLPSLVDILNGESQTQTLSDLNSSYAFYMLVKSYFINNSEDITFENITNLIEYTNKQANSEVMQMLNVDILGVINKKMSKELKNKLHYYIFENPDFAQKNKDFVKKIKDFKTSLVA